MLQDVGCCVASDGMTNVSGEPLVNFLAVTPHGAEFLGTVASKEVAKDQRYLAARTSEVIEQLGAKSVVQNCTDTAAACKAAGGIVEEEFSHTTWVPCAAHVTDLALEDIGKLPWAKSVIKQARKLVSFISNHHKTHAIYERHTNLQLLRPAETRFATAFLCLERLQTVKKALEKTVTDEAWDAWVEDQQADVRRKAGNMKSRVFNPAFWQVADELVAISKPLVSLLRLADGNKPCMGKIYAKTQQVQQQLADMKLPASHHKAVSAVASKRLPSLITCLHHAGYLLDPEFHGSDAFNDAVCMTQIWHSSVACFRIFELLYLLQLYCTLLWHAWLLPKAGQSAMHCVQSTAVPCRKKN